MDAGTLSSRREWLAGFLFPGMGNLFARRGRRAEEPEDERAVGWVEESAAVRDGEVDGGADFECGEAGRSGERRDEGGGALVSGIASVDVSRSALVVSAARAAAYFSWRAGLCGRCGAARWQRER